ncbi:MAG TPA: aminotransferase class I/II-fold pyridoxal phosphate-dependent enzyme, partial [Anaeromyxobacteraceae bacterium]|nr:aminotransferase class I/II-fold pyridoxal phosphate-dependent enzyme [Anaeromyxobacteraceae bacterium]
MAEPSRFRTTPLREHGGGLDEASRASGLPPELICDFSVNVNPYGPSSALVAAVRAAPLERYPDPTAAPVRRAIGARLGVEPERVVFGSGATDLLWTLARVALAPGARLLSVEPAFSELRAAAESCGAEVGAWRPPPGAGLGIDLDTVGTAAAGAALVALCTPTSPAGLPLDPAGVAALARRVEPALVLLDESFLSLSDLHADLAAPMPWNVVRLRSLTKAHAIPGLRAGYLVGPRPLAEAVEAS